MKNYHGLAQEMKDDPKFFWHADGLPAPAEGLPATIWPLSPKPLQRHPRRILRLRIEWQTSEGPGCRKVRRQVTSDGRERFSVFYYPGRLHVKVFGWGA